MNDSPPVKTVITVPWGERLGGAESMLWTFLRHVDRTRVEPLVVFLQAGPFEQDVANLGLRTAVVPAGRLRNVRSTMRVVLRLARLFRLEHPDVILNWSSKTQLYGAPAAVLAGVTNRLIWWQHGLPSGHWMDRLATLLPARVVGCSSHHSAEAQQRLRPTRKTFVVHPGVDPVERPTAAEVATVRAELGIPPARPVVGIIGRLQPWKGQHHLVRALAGLRGEGLEAHGLLVGGNAWDLSPGYEEELRQLVDELDLAESVTFTGQVPDATPYIATLDVLLNASDHEPFGIVLLEAMAMGVPVVAAASGGPLEIVENGVSGFLVPSDDFDPTPVLARLLREPDLRSRVGQQGRERVATSFASSAMTARLEAALATVVKA